METGSVRLLITILFALFTAACSVKAVQTPESTPIAVEKQDHPTNYVIEWPVDRARLTQRFHPFTRRPHMGIDLAAPLGTHVFAAQYGTVIYAGHAFRGYGRLVIIQQNDKWATFYAHLKQIRVREGQVVHAGQLIGLMGHSGNAHGNHLHFELRENRVPVNPLQYLPGGTNI